MKSPAHRRWVGAHKTSCPSPAGLKPLADRAFRLSFLSPISLLCRAVERTLLEESGPLEQEPHASKSLSFISACHEDRPPTSGSKEIKEMESSESYMNLGRCQGLVLGDDLS